MKKAKPTAALHNLGCKVNAYETEKMAKALSDAGYTIVAFDDQADVYVINTCSVTQIADKKSRQMIHRARRINPDAIVVAAGCFVQAGGVTPEELGADILLGNDKKGTLIEAITRFYKERRAASDIADIGVPGHGFEELYHKGDDVQGEGAHTRAFVKIQDGCDRFCSYCRIPYVRGRSRSRQAASVIDEIKALVRRGYQEVVLTGIHVSSYRDGETTLLELIEGIDAACGLRRLRLSSIEPLFITKEAAERLANVAALCPHFHLSLQSGCDATIARMNRKYTTADFAEGVRFLREVFDQPAITTDVIVGFPGESVEEFDQTKRFLKTIGFSDMHVFKFSPREGTRAYTMEGQVPAEEKNRRSEELIALSRRMHEDFVAAWRDREGEVLFEERTDRGYTGFTREYIRVYKESKEDLRNRIETVIV